MSGLNITDSSVRYGTDGSPKGDAVAYNSLGDVSSAAPLTLPAAIVVGANDNGSGSSSGSGSGNRSNDETKPLTGSVNRGSGGISDGSSSSDVEVDVVTTSYVYRLTFFAAIGGFLFGYDTGVISGAILFITDDFNLTDFEVECAVSGATLGAMFGALFGGPLSDKFGRRRSIMSAAVVFTAGAVVMGAAPNFAVLLIGRLIVGVGVGVASATVPVYVGEVAPPQRRGFLISVNSLAITGGQFISYLMDSALADVSGGWRWMVGLSAIPAIVQFVGMWSLPESPRFLYATGQPAAARTVLSRILNKSETDSAVNSELTDIATELDAEATGTWSQLWTVPGLRRAMIVACGLQFFQQFTGINTAMYYSPVTLKSAGFNNNTQAILFADAVAFTNALMTVVAMRLIDRVGRRTLLLRTLIGVVVGLFLLGGTFYLISRTESAHDTCEAYVHCSMCVAAKHCGWCTPPGLTASDGFCVTGNKTAPYLPVSYAAASSSASGVMECTNWALNAGCGGTIGGWLALVSLVVYVAFFGVGLGTVPWTMQSEIFPTAVRGKANGIATAVNWSSNFVVSMTFLTLSNRMSQAGTFWLYAAIGVAAWFFVYAKVPETKGKTLEQISADFAANDHTTRNTAIPAATSSSSSGGVTVNVSRDQPRNRLTARA